MFTLYYKVAIHEKENGRTQNETDFIHITSVMFNLCKDYT